MTTPLRKPCSLPLAAGLALVGLLAFPGQVRSARAEGPTLIGSGSSFAGPEIEQWRRDVSRSPYNVTVNYTSSSSGQGRQQFRDKVVDFAVTDIRYNKFDGQPPPDGSYIYVPVTAGGIGIMYNLKKHGFAETGKKLQLSPRTVCGIFTGGIAKWNSPEIAADNPGANLPDVAIRAVIRTDPAGTNFVLGEYCMAKERAIFDAFIDAANRQPPGGFAKEPNSSWPVIGSLVGAEGSERAADQVAGQNNDGFVTAVEPGYAIQRGFPVANVKNSAGKYVEPNEANVGAALSYARQLEDGTHELNFDPPSQNAYNPSTYSYLLARIKDFPAEKGAVLTKFGNYALTIGQKVAVDKLTYASIGKNLIEFGLKQLEKVPGHVPPTAEERAAIPREDQFNVQTVDAASAVGGADGPGVAALSAPGSGGGAETGSASGAAGGTGGPTGGTGGPTGSAGGPGSAAGAAAGPGSADAGGPAGSGGAASTGGSGGAASGSRRSGTGSGSGTAVGSSGSSGASGASGGETDPSVSLDPVASTGAEHQLLAAMGLGLVMFGEWGRTSVRRRRRTFA